MIKKLFLVPLIFLTLLLLVGCSANNGPKDNGGSEEQGGSSSVIADNSNRKIIYTAHLSIKTNNLGETTAKIKVLLDSSEWVQEENLTENNNYLTIRIKTSRLNAFLNELKNDYETTNYRLESKDVSLDYINIAAKKDALTKERERLVELYENASINDMIMINRRIGEVDQELIRIERQLLEYDSLVDYSTVNLWIHGPKSSPKPPTLSNKVSRSFNAGWDSTVVLFHSFVQVIVFIIPLLIIIVPVSLIIIFFVIRNKRKNKK